jgi:UDP-N-acetylmuramate dehydrogenase
VHYPVKNQQGQATGKVKLAAGWLIDQAGLKGKGIAPILTHIHQALVLTNHAPQVATQADIERTMTLIQQTVYQQFGVMLEPEPVWIESDGRIRQTH